MIKRVQSPKEEAVTIQLETTMKKRLKRRCHEKLRIDALGLFLGFDCKMSKMGSIVEIQKQRLELVA